jgi:SAM-dependent methyltransferase
VDGPNVATWFEDHYFDAPRQIVEFLAGDGLSLANARVADLGCGDGLIALGLHAAVGPAELVGFDLEPVDEVELLRMAREHGVADALPQALRFEQSSTHEIPAPDDAFDVVVSWSAFEHVSEPEVIAGEIRRVLAPFGVALIQVFPFYASEHGDHGWSRPPFAHVITGEDEPAPGSFPLNKITLDGLDRALRAGGMRTVKVELIHGAFHVPAELEERSLSEMAIGGVKLLAVPDEERPGRAL